MGRLINKLFLMLFNLIIVSVKGETCSAGEGLGPVAIRTSGECNTYITDEEECKTLAKAAGKMYVRCYAWNRPKGCLMSGGGCFILTHTTDPIFPVAIITNVYAPRHAPFVPKAIIHQADTMFRAQNVKLENTTIKQDKVNVKCVQQEKQRYMKE